MTITIAGTAGRKEDGPKLNKSLYSAMCLKTLEIIDSLYLDSESKITLVSGGAAWADHIAVLLFLKYPGKLNLDLCLPTNIESEAYFDDGSIDWVKNPGRTCNCYHRKFGLAVDRRPIRDINKAIELGAKAQVFDGFYARNATMAQSDMVIALTFGNNVVKNGGTKHMTDLYIKDGGKELFHISLPSLEIKRLVQNE